MLEGARRIHIVGGPGSGKTTLAAALASHFGYTAHHLDNVALTDGAASDFRPKRALALRKRDVARLSDGPAWVTEGSYLWWTEVLFEHADIIVWLDTPWPIAARQIVSRHARDYISDIAQAPHLQLRLRALRYPHVRSLIAFLRWSRHYYQAPAATTLDVNPDDMLALTRATTSTYLERFGPKVRRIVEADPTIAIADLERGMWQRSAGLLIEPNTPAQGLAGS